MELYKWIFMSFGFLLVVIGVILFFKRGAEGQNKVKLLNMEFQLAGSSLVIIVLGLGLFVLPFFRPDAFTNGPPPIQPPRDLPREARELDYKGQTAERKGEHDIALDLYNSAIKLNPYDATAHYNRGTVYAKKGDLASAISDYSRALELNRNYALAYHSRGIVFRNFGDREKSISDLTKAMLLEPDNPDHYLERGVSYGMDHQNDLAIADFTQAITLKPHYPLAYFNRGNSYAIKEECDNASKDFEEALKQKPGYEKARERLNLVIQYCRKQY